MRDYCEQWQFMRRRAEQLYQEGETGRALRMMRLINREQEKRFEDMQSKEEPKKIVSTR